MGDHGLTALADKGSRRLEFSLALPARRHAGPVHALRAQSFEPRRVDRGYPGAELYFHSLVGNTLRGHKSMGGMLRVEPSLIVQVGQASFRVLTGSESGAELLVRVYQAAFELAAEQIGYSVENMTRAIFQTFIERAEAEGEGDL